MGLTQNFGCPLSVPVFKLWKGRLPSEHSSSTIAGMRVLDPSHRSPFAASLGANPQSPAAVIQQREVTQSVHVACASRTTLRPRRVEHEVIDDELPAAVEKALEGLFSFRAIEEIVLFDLHHGKPAPAGIYPVAMLSEILLKNQELLSLGEPFLLQHDFWMLDCVSRHCITVPQVNSVTPRAYEKYARAAMGCYFPQEFRKVPPWVRRPNPAPRCAAAIPSPTKAYGHRA